MAEEASWERLVGSPEDRALSEKVCLWTWPAMLVSCSTPTPTRPNPTIQLNPNPPPPPNTQIFGAVQQRILLFSPEEQYRAATWILLGSIRPRLFTDDTFDFRRAMRELREYVTCLQPFDAARDAFADGERRRAVLAALGTALKRGACVCASGVGVGMGWGGGGLGRIGLSRWADYLTGRLFVTCFDRAALPVGQALGGGGLRAGDGAADAGLPGRGAGGAGRGACFAFVGDQRCCRSSMAFFLTPNSLSPPPPPTQMATQLRAAKHGQSVGGNVAGSVVARSVRLADSMSTPWNRKAGDIFR